MLILSTTYLVNNKLQFDMKMQSLILTRTEQINNQIFLWHVRLIFCEIIKREIKNDPSFYVNIF